MKCPNCETEMKLISSIYSWLDAKPTFCLEEHRCPKCGTRMGTRTFIETYKKGKDA